MEDRPIRPYVPAPVAVAEWDPRSPDVAARLIALIEEAAPGHVVEHVGSSAVPGLIGKGIIDLVVPAEPEEIPGMVDALYGLGFGPQQGPAAWPPTRPMLVGQVVHEGTEFQVHLHIVPPERDDFREFVGFRDALRDDPALRDGYVHAKTSVLDAAGGPIDGRRYSTAKSPFVEDALFSHGIRRVPADRPVALAPGATIGISAAGSSAGCSAWPRARWAIGSPSSTRMRSVPRRPSPTRWSWAATTTSMQRFAWPSARTS